MTFITKKEAHQPGWQEWVASCWAEIAKLQDEGRWQEAAACCSMLFRNHYTGGKEAMPVLARMKPYLLSREHKGRALPAIDPHEEE